MQRPGFLWTQYQRLIDFRPAPKDSARCATTNSRLCRPPTPTKRNRGRNRLATASQSCRSPASPNEGANYSASPKSGPRTAARHMRKSSSPTAFALTNSMPSWRRIDVPIPEIRLRAPTPDLLSLPWDKPLSDWMMPEVALRDIAVGPSRHLVKFVDADDRLWALKDLPPRIAVREYEVLRRMEELGLPAVRPAGLVVQPDFDTAILVTQYLEGSWQYRRLLMRLPPDQPTHRARLFDAMANLLVNGVVQHRHDQAVVVDSCPSRHFGM